MNVPFDKPLTCPVLIGRTRERAAMDALIDLARSGQGQTILIRGEAGIGKSRLVAMAKDMAVAQGFLILQGESFPADASYPYAPLIGLLRVFFTAQLTALHTADQERLVGELVRLLPDLGVLFPQLAPIAMPQTLSPEQHRRRLLTTLTQLLVSLAAQQPILLIIEDLHWADESSLDVLLHLVRQSTHQALCCVFTYRDEETSAYLRHWLAQCDRERLAHELVLLPLAQAEVEAMLQAIFPAPYPIPTAIAGTIYTLAEGNPFFVEELLKSLIASGELKYVDRAWAYRLVQQHSGGFSLIPRSVQQVVNQRAQRLSASAIQALTVAAVAGRRFDFTMLQQVLHCDEAQLLVLMKELIAAQFVVEQSADQFAFRHALIQQAIYHELLARECMSLHRTIAENLEALSASPALRETHLDDLAYHFYAAGVWAKALEYEQRAGERALALYAPGAAIVHLTHALEAADHLQMTGPSTLYHARGQAYAIRGEFERAQDDYERALELAHAACDGVNEWQSMMALGFLWAGRDYTQAGAWFRHASQQAAHFADPTLRARSLNRLGNWLVNTGRSEEGLQAHNEALEIFEQQHNSQGMAETLDLLGITYGMRGDRVKAVEQLGQAISLFRALGDTSSLSSCLAMRALQSIPGANETIICPLRTRNECVQDATEALLMARQIDSLAGQAFAENALAHTLLSFGEFGPALAHMQAAQRTATQIGHQQWMVATASGLGRIYLLLRAPVSAIAILNDGLSLAQELGSRFWIASLAANLARAYILNHDLTAAQATLEAIMPCEQQPQNVAERDVALVWGELALAQGEPGVALYIAERLVASVPSQLPDQPTQPIPHLLHLKGAALLALAHLDQAIPALQDALQGAQERNARPLLWTIHCSLGHVYRLLRREDQARHELAAARQLIEELATTIDAAPLGEQFLRAAIDSLPRQKPLHQREASKRAFGGLTAREREVAALVAQGKTSREIANLLVVSERTAEVHVSNILGKLGFTSRAQIAAWAVEKGLTTH